MRQPIFSAGLVALASSALCASANAELVYGVTLQGSLVSWDSAAPSNYLSAASILNLNANEVVKGIDFRPLTGEIWALTSQGNVNGSQFGFDFNPTVDRIRVVADTNLNIRLNPLTGLLAATDATLAYAIGDANAGVDPNVVHAAYTNNVAGATTTTLYGIDSGTNTLVIQNPPNNGTLNSVGALSIVGGPTLDISAYGGFDISGATGAAFAALTLENESITRFYTINLANGAASPVGEIGGGEIITAMTIVPTPASLVLGAISLGLIARRKR
jgi:Domain of unknown function (DUF4394)